MFILPVKVEHDANAWTSGPFSTRQWMTAGLLHPMSTGSPQLFAGRLVILAAAVARSSANELGLLP